MLCSEMSRAREEPLAGTAAHAPVILALEENGGWARAALDSAGLETFREALASALERLGARLQLIRKASARPCETRRLILADTTHGTHRSFDVEEERLTEFLHALDTASINEAPDDTPVYLVCTHGKRDRCCALEGGSYYRALGATEAHQVWMTSHLGGHRFAATMVCLPSGLCYGRLTPDDVDPSTLPTGRLRGRMGYEPAVQRAEIALLELVSPGQST